MYCVCGLSIMGKFSCFDENDNIIILCYFIIVFVCFYVCVFTLLPCMLFRPVFLFPLVTDTGIVCSHHWWYLFPTRNRCS